jgi:RimJ/RimL family protein N-acetyltransferase
MEIDKSSLILENEGIYLRPLRPDDITDEYVSGLNDPEVNRSLVNVRKCRQTHETVRQFVVSNWESPSCILFGIFVKSDRNSLVGTVRVSEIDFFHYSAVIGVCLFATRAWKKGFALQAVRMVKEYLFRIHNIHYIEAGVYAQNKNSVALFTRAGFREWFRVKDKFRLVDSFEEVIYFAALNPSYNWDFLKQEKTG